MTPLGWCCKCYVHYKYTTYELTSVIHRLILFFFLLLLLLFVYCFVLWAKLSTVLLFCVVDVCYQHIFIIVVIVFCP